MSHRVGRMPLAAEVNCFQTEIRSYEGFVPTWDSQDSAIVPYADPYSG